MKTSKLAFLFNALLVIFSLAILLPVLRVNVFGTELKLPDLGRLCLGGGEKYCLLPKEYNFENGRDFVMQNRLEFQLTDIPTYIQLPQTELDNVVKILNNRLEISGIDDYLIQERVNVPKGLYGIEIYLPDDGMDYSSIMRILTSQGKIQFYEDDPNYQPGQDTEKPDFDLLAGKIPSATISQQDIERSRYYFDNQIGREGAFVLRLDFSSAANEALVKVDSATKQARSLVPGVQLVLDGNTVAVQAAPLNYSVRNNQKQLYMVFADIFNLKSVSYIKAVTSLFNTQSFDSTLTLVGVSQVESNVSHSSSTLLKILIPSSLLALALASWIWDQRRGLLYGIAGIIYFLLVFAWVKVFGVFGERLTPDFILISYAGMIPIILLVHTWGRNTKDVHAKSNIVRYILLLATAIVGLLFAILNVLGISNTLVIGIIKGLSITFLVGAYVNEFIIPLLNKLNYFKE